MARKKNSEDTPVPPATPKQQRGSRHKPRKMVALEPVVYEQLKQLADRNSRPLRWQLRHVVIQALREAGLWPPPGGQESTPV